MHAQVHAAKADQQSEQECPAHMSKVLINRERLLPFMAATFRDRSGGLRRLRGHAVARFEIAAATIG